jgi:hypothetical protein
LSLDRIQSKFGLLQFSAEPVVGATGTASTIATNQYPGGYGLGPYVNILPGSNSTNGGGFCKIPSPRGQATTDFQSFATTGMISHDNAPTVLISVSTTGIALNMQQAVSHGQIVDLVFIPGTTGSIVSTLNTTGFGGTTTAACAVIDAAITFASTGAIRLQAFAQRGGTATTNVPFVWHRIAYS